MSQAFPSSTMPLDASLPDKQGSRSSQLLDSIRGFWRLLWIEFRRCGGYWMLPVILPLVWFMNRYQIDDGVVLWYRMSIITFQSYVIIGPLTAGLAAWLAGRDRRRRTGGLIETAPMRPFRRDLVLLGAAAGWGLVAYAVVAAWFLGRAVLFATWGGPDLGWLAVGVVAIVLHATLGYLIGRLIPGRFAALVAVALPIGFAIGVDAYNQATEFDMGNGMGMATSYERPLRVLSPFSLSSAMGYNDDGIVRFATTYIRDSLLWLAGLLGVTLAAIALIRYRRSPIGMAGLGLSIVVATLGAYSLLDDRHEGWNGEGESRLLPFEWSCQTGSVIEVCLHPAYEARLDDVTETMSTLVTPVAGLPGVPNLWRQSLPTDNYLGMPGGIGAILGPFDGYMLSQSVTQEIFRSDIDGGNPKSSQLVVISALAEQAEISTPGIWLYGMPSEAMTMGSQGFPMPDESKMAALEREVDAAVDRFVALSPEQQRAWLEANWAALRAGELTLEDMP